MADYFSTSGTGTWAGSLSDLHFPLLRSWQKPRFLPAETKLMSDKRAGARLVDRRSTRRVPSRGETHCVERVARAGRKRPAGDHGWSPRAWAEQGLRSPMATQGLRAAGIA